MSNVRLISPVVEVAAQKQFVNGGVLHARGQNPRAECKAACVRRRVPARVRLNLEQKPALFKLLHERVVRAVCKGDVRNQNFFPAAHVILNGVREKFRAVTNLAVVNVVVGLVSFAGRVRVHRQDKIRAALVVGQSCARRFNRRPNRFVNRLIGISGNSLFAASPVVFDENFRRSVCTNINRPRQKNKSDFVNARRRQVVVNPAPVFQKFSAFVVRLRKGRVVVAAEQKIIKSFVARVVD